MGSLAKIWVDIPVPGDMEELAAEFEKFFRARWGDVMVGGDRPFVFHKDWEAYFSVTGLKPLKGLTISGLSEKDKRFNITIGI